MAYLCYLFLAAKVWPNRFGRTEIPKLIEPRNKDF